MPKASRRKTRKKKRQPKKTKSEGNIDFDSFNAWFNQLKPPDQTNFQLLVGLDNALEILTKMDEGLYREMVVFGVALKHVMSREAERLDDANSK